VSGKLPEIQTTHIFESHIFDHSKPFKGRNGAETVQYTLIPAASHLHYARFFGGLPRKFFTIDLAANDDVNNFHYDIVC
jgi:hypothetical protein